MASDKDHRPCLPLKPQEKNINKLYIKKIFTFLKNICRKEFGN